jgi:aminoglycoside phosphotransferase (APT) family kinase protein
MLGGRTLDQVLAAPFARRALDLVTRPVPALATGEFMHGDFTTRNMLFDRDRLSAIIDVEGFGTGTRVVDLVALPQVAAHPSHGSRPVARRLTEKALAIGGRDTFAACLAHRVLAGLAAATQHPTQLDDARERSQGLLAMVD